MMKFITSIFIGTFYAVTALHAIQIDENKASPKIFVAQDKTYPIVGVSIMINHMGILADKKGQEGQTPLAITLLMDHFQRHKDKFQKLGMDGLEVQMDVNTVLTFVVPKKNLTQSLQLLFHEMQKFIPTLDRFRTLKLMYTQTNFMPNASFPFDYMQRRLYQLSFPTDPVFSIYLGNYDTIQALNIEDFSNFWTRHLTKNNLVFSLCGDMTLSEAEQIISTVTKDLPEKGPSIQKDLSDSPPLLENDIKVIQIDKPQTHLIFNLKGVQYNHPDYYSYVLLNAALGGNAYTSRLWKKLRDEHGFVYDVSTYLAKYANLMYGMLTISNEHVFEAIGLIKKELLLLKEKGITKEELKNLKEQALGNTLLGLVTLTGLSKNIIEAYSRNIDATQFIEALTKKINDVTLDNINRVAKEIDPENILFILVGNPTPPKAEQKQQDINPPAPTPVLTEEITMIEEN